MKLISRFFYAAAISTALATSASAQSMTGGGGTQGGGGTGQNQQGTGNVGGLPFGAGGSVGIQSQQMSTVSNSATNTQSNVLGGYYANPFFQGRIGTSGATTPGGFGAVLYSTGTSGGMTGSSGNRTGGSSFGGTNGATGGRTGGTGSTGFGGSSSTGSTGFGGGGTTGFGGTGGTGRTGGTGATGFGGGQTGFGATGLGGGTGFGGGTMGGRGTMGGFGGTGMNGQNQNVITADRSYNTLLRPAQTNLPTSSSPALTMRAQTDLRGLFDNSTNMVSGKKIDVSVNEAGLARLRGTVASEDEKRMAIGLASMSAGVRQVVSELTVQPQP